MNTLSPSLPALALPLRLRRSVPVIYQSETAECGLACLCMVANFHGAGLDMTSLRQTYGVSQRGATLKNLMDIATALGLSARALKAEPADLKQLQLPAVLHWDLQHFVVLTRVTRQGVTLHDPAVGERKLDWEAVDRHFSGVALEVQPASDFQPAPASPRLSFRYFWQRITGLKRALAVLLVLSVLLQVFSIASPYYMQTVIDDVLLRQQQDLLMVLALGFGLLLCVETFTSVVRRLVILSVSSRLQLQMSANVFQHLLKLPLDYFAKRHVGDIVSRFGSLAKIREFLTTGLVTAVLDGVMALVTLVVMAIYSPLLTWVVCGFVVLYVLSRIALTPVLRKLTAQRIDMAAKEQSHFIESVRAIQPVRIFNQEGRRQNQWQNRLVSTLNTDIRLGKWDIGASTLNQLLFGLENIVIIYLAATLVMANTFSVGMLYAFIAYKSRFTSSVDSLVTHVIEFSMLRVHFERLADMVFTPTEPRQEGTATLPSCATAEGTLQVSQLAFQYSAADKPVFEHVSFTVPQGSLIAIVGASGTGKSTLLKCMMGLFAPSHGTVTLNGNSVFGTHWYRAHVASVMQDDCCLAGTIADNIGCFEEAIDLDRMVAAARMACIHDDILRMPMQYQTLVGDMGSALSGGQLQRVLLARALYRQPAILFLDEASSHLDVANEQAINANLRALNITRIIVAHRPQTIAMADTVYSLTSEGLTLVPPHTGNPPEPS
ncbi:peptidase domain-containing ABC transporter [Alteromonas sp. ASW11-19]|uniref:Peptidase domain-containing ABC transporter n=1 Tax=Alteromonas salexigens TaxID=2982530 RepID=A0ABT2VN52_9ALTE|nr:peptidase domain-containing ABC transporter [Alteromonas salexigens]MCU7554514.1 peptidase domain-containing ABC transporter [Alteromonas salexigens]